MGIRKDKMKRKRGLKGAYSRRVKDKRRRQDRRRRTSMMVEEGAQIMEGK